ncbi:DUF2795 domain-containing protein [Streptomyces sp. NPDC017056]|uniref:DUF2795 domain-containing protein n=1 Tax=Streptomyces sp. NPDC017056 TaxID=3364973 RepID=UPI00379D0BA6
MDHGTNKTGPARDDMMKKQIQGELKADRALRAEEDHDPEPSGEDQPDVTRSAGAPFGGSTPDGMTPEAVEIRTEMAQHLGRAVYPADRNAIIGTLRQNNAPDRLVELAQRLPENERYENAQRIVESLGLTREHRA